MPATPSAPYSARMQGAAPDATARDRNDDPRFPRASATERGRDLQAGADNIRSAPHDAGPAVRGRAAEPSMEELLASIRRIIAEEDLSSALPPRPAVDPDPFGCTAEEELLESFTAPPAPPPRAPQPRPERAELLRAEPAAVRPPPPPARPRPVEPARPAPEFRLMPQPAAPVADAAAGPRRPAPSEALRPRPAEPRESRASAAPGGVRQAGPHPSAPQGTEARTPGGRGAEARAPDVRPRDPAAREVPSRPVPMPAAPRPDPAHPEGPAVKPSTLPLRAETPAEPSSGLFGLRAEARPPRKDLLSPGVDAAVSAAFDSLGDLKVPARERTVEDLVKEILRPMLKDWLDAKLPDIVERLVRAEIERVSRAPRG